MHWEQTIDGVMWIVGVSASADHRYTSSIPFKMAFLSFDVGIGNRYGAPIHRHQLRVRCYLADFGFDEKSGGKNMSVVVRPPGPGMRSTGEKEE